MKKILFALFASSMFISCKQPAAVIPTVKAPIDSLVNNWSNSWNNHDSAAVRNMFTADALLIDDNLVAVNANEMSAKWISPNINVVNHLKSSELQQWSTNDRAGYTGKYEFDVLVKDSVVAKPTGVFTITWIKGNKADWKITTAVIHSFIKK